MKRSLAKLVVLAVALWLPVQAIAVPWLALRCSDSEMGVMHVHSGGTQEHHGADARAVPDGQEEGPTDQYGNGTHFCCHHFSAIPSHLTIDRAVPAGFEPVIVLVRDYRFFPEPGNRPPLVHLV